MALPWFNRLDRGNLSAQQLLQHGPIWRPNRGTLLLRNVSGTLAHGQRDIRTFRKFRDLALLLLLSYFSPAKPALGEHSESGCRRTIHCVANAVVQ